MAKKSTIALVAAVVTFAIAASLLLITFMTGTMLDTKLIGGICVALIFVFLFLIGVNLYFRNKENQTE